MSSEWEKTTIDCVTTLVTKGTTPTSIGGGFSKSGIPFVKVESISESGRLIPDKFAFIDSSTDELLGRSRIQQDDVLFSIAGTIGRVALVSRENGQMNTNQAVALVRPDTSLIEPRFLYYSLRDTTRIQVAQSKVVQSVQANFSLGELKQLQIDLPPKAEQKAIAHILGTLDDKIELNRKANETLEAMAKALFKSWFVDFDPVRAKAEGRSTGLPDEISDLFPDSFEDSELGEIPSGWNVQSAGKQYDISIGKTPPRKESQWFSTSKVDMPWLSIRDLGEVGVYADRTSESLTREAVEKFNVKIVPPDTAVLSFKLTIGRVAITGSEMLTNEAIAHFSSLTKGAGSEYTYCLLSQYDYHSLGSTSSIATAVNSQILRDMPLVVPPETIARAFCDTAAPIFSSIKCGQQETHCLSDFRDALLPRLISGEIRIPDAEKILEEVGV
ncbi:restriction endonuclease subunit S [Cyanobium sp. WKJ7-Wakatipu]|uniref:restriction endonuclease subunit S n=1 Tax=Cyanobium sp. WKJ7-Wakatipu TaxID=2823726 RepID=UPI0020CC4486|nr:restriction endonuclease subunit S [Cyanobium sp. WKJ7-Wakatipu]MCP9783788.1 restriction endonuclease subunit S [Cyanobium sp. WKJ7-Wakatipu]